MGVKIPRGNFTKDGKPITNAEEVLDASCKCGIDCCNGILKLVSYNSVSGDSTNYGLYIVDGEAVTNTISAAKLAIKDLKAIVPPSLPTTPILNGSFIWNFGNSDDVVTYIVGTNRYEASVPQGLLSQSFSFSLTGYGGFNPITVTSLSAGYTASETLPYTTTSNYDGFNIISGPNGVGDSIDINLSYLGDPYVLRITRSA